MSIGKAQLIVAGSNAITASLLEYVAPKVVKVQIEGAGPKSKYKRAIRTGITAGAASLLNNFLNVSGQLPVAPSIPYVTQISIGDGVLFATLAALMGKGQRSSKRIFYNLLTGIGISSLSTNVVLPIVGPTLGAATDMAAGVTTGGVRNVVNTNYTGTPGFPG